MIPTIEIRRINPELENALNDFFISIQPDVFLFCPHELTKTKAHEVANYTGDDLYYVLQYGNDIVGYGILRGWDTGFLIPSLGIAIAKEFRGCGWGKTLMHFLHSVAKQRGAKEVRLRVRDVNTIAINLYKSMGYIFNSKEDDLLVGIFQL